MGTSAISVNRLAKNNNDSVPKGYVPLLVGGDTKVRVLVRVRILKDPCISSMLDAAAEELGYAKQGILELPCEVEHFRWIVSEISKAL